jgi:hypothetical protein
MISKVELSLDGNTYILTSVSFEFKQIVDEIGRPSSGVNGGIIEIEMNAIEDEIFIDWMIQPKKKLKGEIVFYETDQSTKAKEIKFEESFCVAYTERFSEGVEIPMAFITLSSEKLKVGNTELNNNWPK